MKPNFARRLWLGFGFVHQFADGVEDNLEALVMRRQFVLNLVEFEREPSLVRQHPAHVQECSDDEDADFNRSLGLQDACQHHSAVLRECVGQEARVSVPLGTGRKLRPVRPYV